jgi:hypothetical protein
MTTVGSLFTGAVPQQAEHAIRRLLTRVGAS